MNPTCYHIAKSLEPPRDSTPESGSNNQVRSIYDKRWFFLAREGHLGTMRKYMGMMEDDALRWERSIYMEEDMFYL